MTLVYALQVPSPARDQLTVTRRVIVVAVGERSHERAKGADDRRDP